MNDFKPIEKHSNATWIKETLLLILAANKEPNMNQPSKMPINWKMSKPAALRSQIRPSTDWQLKNLLGIYEQPEVMLSLKEFDDQDLSLFPETDFSVDINVTQF